MSPFTSAPPLWVEIVRTGVILLGFTLIGQVVVLWRYRRQRDQEGGKRPGEMPEHILLSWVLLIVFVIAEITERYGEALSWRTPLALLALGTSEYAIWSTLQRARGDGRGRATT